MKLIKLKITKYYKILQKNKYIDEAVSSSYYIFTLYSL